MKKLALIFLFWTAFLPLIAQTNVVTVQGYVTDSANGSPIPNHPVTIQVDSTSGFFYYNVVYTLSNGFYIDTIVFNITIPTSNVYVSTYDCMQNLLSATLPFSPGNQTLIHNFQICNTAPPCHADFSSQYLGNLAVQFTDLSTGGTFSWLWQFGDGSSSNLENPAHTFPASGIYAVGLTVYDTSTNCIDTKTKYVQ